MPSVLLPTGRIGSRLRQQHPRAPRRAVAAAQGAQQGISEGAIGLVLRFGGDLGSGRRHPGEVALPGPCRAQIGGLPLLTRDALGAPRKGGVEPHHAGGAEAADRLRQPLCTEPRVAGQGVAGVARQQDARGAGVLRGLAGEVDEDRVAFAHATGEPAVEHLQQVGPGGRERFVLRSFGERLRSVVEQELDVVGGHATHRGQPIADRLGIRGGVLHVGNAGIVVVGDADHDRPSGGGGLCGL